jgi:hypothetical protein
MDEKIASIKKNDIWKLVPRPSRKKPIGVKWIYKENKNIKWEVERYKVRLVEKDYSQKHEIDYDKVFAPIARLETIWLIIAMASQHRLRIY